MYTYNIIKNYTQIDLAITTSSFHITPLIMSVIQSPDFVYTVLIVKKTPDFALLNNFQLQTNPYGLEK